MTALPIKGDLDGSSPGHNQGVFKAAIGAMRDYLAGIAGTSGEPSDALLNLKALDSKLLTNLAPDFSVATNILTITMKDAGLNALSSANPALISQRSATAGSAAINVRKITANFSMTLGVGSTLGHTSNKLSQIFVYVIDNAGTQELAVSASFLGETGIFSTTAEGGGTATSGTTLYSTVARANVAGRLVAIVWTTQTTAGQWAALPSKVKMAPFLLQVVGEILDYFGGSVQYGCYLMDGSNTSRTGDNAWLFSKVGTVGGAGDGSTTFGVGDSRRKVLVGSGGSGTGTLGNVVGNTGGTETHTLAVGETPVKSHAHTQQGTFGSGGRSADHTHAGQSKSDAVNSIDSGLLANSTSGSGPFGWSTGGASADHSHNTTISGSTTSTQDTTATGHNNIQPSLVVTKMIRWLGDL